jgi:hypothetical protein
MRNGKIPGRTSLWEKDWVNNSIGLVVTVCSAKRAKAITIYKTILKAGFTETCSSNDGTITQA